jgi:hypothetical protein
MAHAVLAPMAYTSRERFCATIVLAIFLVNYLPII